MGSGVTITGTMTGLETSVSGGLHIHSGYSCLDADDVVGHWWDSDALPDADGEADVSITVTAAELGFDPTSFVGHTIVVHDSNTAKVACGVLGEAQSESDESEPESGGGL